MSKAYSLPTPVVNLRGLSSHVTWHLLWCVAVWQEITADGMVDASELAYLYQRVQALNAVYNLDDLARLMIRVRRPD